MLGKHFPGDKGFRREDLHDRAARAMTKLGKVTNGFGRRARLSDWFRRSLGAFELCPVGNEVDDDKIFRELKLN
jgi:hypothetical protein